MHENECYIGQPFTGYALAFKSEREFIIICILIQKHHFFQTCLSILSSDSRLFHFFLDAQRNEYADDFIHLSFKEVWNIRRLLEMMAVEYSAQKEDTQAILQGLVLTLLLYVARQYRETFAPRRERNSGKIMRYIVSHLGDINLTEAARTFSYHPNYFSALLRRQYGKSFSRILLELRMERAVNMLKNTDLSIETIASMLGYSNSGNFYKAFRAFYGESPRDFTNTRANKTIDQKNSQ